MNSKVVSSSVVALLLIGFSCTSSLDNGLSPSPSLAQVSVRMLATSETAITDANGRLVSLATSREYPHDSITFQQAFLGVSKLEFDPLDSMRNDSSRCDMDDHEDSDTGRHEEEDDDDDGLGKDSSKLVFKGAFVVDLMEGSSRPDFGIAQVIPGVYRKIKIKLSPILEDSSSILIKGTVFVRDTSYQVEFSSRLRMTIVLVDRHGIQLNSTLNDLLVELNLNRFFERINFAYLRVDEDGVIRITQSRNEGLFAALHLRFPEALRIGKDKDHNGHIDD